MRVSTLPFLILATALLATDAHAKKLSVVVTSSAYRSIAEAVGGDKVTVSHIVRGNQDPHIVRPKPSLAQSLAAADLLVATGLDLEAWLPSLQDMAGNPKIMSGQPGYVGVSTGLEVLEKPTSLDRSEGDVHIFGNPHIHTSPLSGIPIAENITIGLRKVAPEHKDFFEANLKRFVRELDERMFGKELIKLLGAETLRKMARKGKLVSFLQKKKFKGKPLIDKLGGWMNAALPLRGLKVINYHKNWTYFVKLFGIEVVGYMEPKPGIPPSPGHVAGLIETMKRDKVKIVLAANYFDQGKVKRVTEKTGAIPVIVALAVDGEPEMKTFFDQFDIWIRELNTALAKSGQS